MDSNLPAPPTGHRTDESFAKSKQPSTVVSELREKLAWCTSRLNETESPEEIGQWAEAIRCLAEAADAVYKCSASLC
ncbi:unnamed protein product [Echinostoma caproni]|uniref:PH domain-containing protein n=1 Tax=Echinostoma caproni TaxID=27848 RepID=A0A183AWV0_9TREM|nr:unnamed protein product [Echinostoma caproni]